MANIRSFGYLGDTSCTGHDKDLLALDTLLESLSKDNNVTQRAASIILNYESFKSQISDILLEKVSSLIKKRRCLRKSA